MDFSKVLILGSMLCLDTKQCVPKEIKLLLSL